MKSNRFKLAEWYRPQVLSEHFHGAGSSDSSPTSRAHPSICVRSVL